MNGMRNLVGFELAGVLAASALPATAATKQFNLTLSAPSGGIVTATFNNLSSGNSVIKSESLTAPNGYAITSASTVAPFAGVVTTTCSPSFPCSTIQVNYQSGIPGNTSASVLLGISSPANVGCSQSAPWAVFAWTGNNLGGSPFNYVGAAPTTVNLTSYVPARRKV